MNAAPIGARSFAMVSIERALTGQWSFPRTDAEAARVVYVTGHRNPDTDSIASAIGYAELKGRIDPGTQYVPVRLGELNTQTRWALEFSGAIAPEYLPHVFLRVRDVMRTDFPTAGVDEPVRAVGLAMAAGDLDLMPVVDDGGALAGVMTERALARRYIRESREVSSLVDTPTSVSAVVRRARGQAGGGARDRTVAGAGVGPVDGPQRGKPHLRGRRGGGRRPPRRSAAARSRTARRS